MKKVAIVTDFLSHDPAYSLCGVVRSQIKILAGNGYQPTVIVRKGFDPTAYPEAEVVAVDPGEIGQNKVNVTERSEVEIESLTNQIGDALLGVDVILTHDTIYQPNQWKFHVAIQRVAQTFPEKVWYHWVHSTTPMNVVDQTKQFANECLAPIYNSKLVVMNPEERDRKGATFGYEMDQIVLCPNPFDIAEDYHGVAIHALNKAGAWLADAVAVYPCRLDRGKQVEVVIEIFGAIQRAGFEARVIVVDFHSSGQDDKADYRVSLIEKGMTLGVPVVFTSSLGADWSYHVPHKAVMDLFDFADFFIHPSRSECDPLILPEAMWKRNGIMLNFDLPMFRLYQEFALMGKFSSNVDSLSGGAGETNTNYSNRDEYMKEMAQGIIYLLQNNPVLKGHIDVRKKRSFHAVWRNHLRPMIEGA